MRLVPLPDSHAVLLYQTPQELPAGVHNEFQHWCLRAAGIGNGPGAIDSHFATTAALLAAGRVEEAGDALALLHYSFADSFDQFSSRQLAFGCLVAAVDGQPWTDRSESGLQRLLALLSDLGLSEEMVAAEVADVKKNWRRR